MSGAALAVAGGGGALCFARGDVGRPEGEQPAGVPVQLRGLRPEEKVTLIALDLADHRRRVLNRLVAETESEAGAEVMVGIALGRSLFDGTTSRPRHLSVMPSFPGDLLDPAQTGGDVLVQIAGRSAERIEAAAERISGAAPADWVPRWRISGERRPSATGGRGDLATNPFHFVEGFGNPETERESYDRAIVSDADDEPPWAVGGSYQVVRIIRMATELWDRDSVAEQERIIGRKRDGRWLDGAPRDEPPNFAADPQGRVTPLDSHVRLAAPDRRNPPKIVRRSYGYSRGADEKGMIFSCFQRDPVQGFEAVQKRLAGESMASYLLTVGGGYFFVPPRGDEWTGALSG